MWRGNQPNKLATHVKNRWKGQSHKGVLRTVPEEGEELLVVCESSDDSCVVASDNRISCGRYDGEECKSRGCCYDASTTNCYMNAKSSPFYSLRRKWSHDSHYVTSSGDTFYKKPEMPCEICPKDIGWNGYNINGQTICHTKPTRNGMKSTFVQSYDSPVTLYLFFSFLTLNDRDKS